ncbi:TetR/AcrR family transcriptional regulator C-terminal domain-containing protein [Streptomyces sp. NPDC002896]|uniref:TetR/AcrR family transcriptional regulator n=1 Tax=Streptomyces sp. NPDC002896 TaxID=3154438 RepID=UPI0033198A34
MVRAAERTRRPARTSVWLEGKAPRGAAGASRGGAPRGNGQPSGLDRDRIIVATVRLLDAEGLPKFSMRRLAAELDVTAMSLYWYVDTKDDILEFALDAAFGELRLPDPESGADWRDQLRELATGYRGLLVRHPWVSPLAGTFLNIGPHYLDFLLTVQRVVRRTGLPPDALGGAISAVFQFVYGFGTIEGHFARRCAAAGMSQDEYVREAMARVEGTPALAELVQESADLVAARSGGTVEDGRERDFSFALDLLVAGIEAKVPGRA